MFLNSNLFAALIGGCFTLAGVFLTNHFQKNQNQLKTNGLESCWEELNDNGNILSFCIYSDETIKRKVIFPNQTIEAVPTVCKSGGNINDMGSKYVINFELGSCDNGRDLIEYESECILSDKNLFVCTHNSPDSEEKVVIKYLRK